MAVFNAAKKEIDIKIVYYGPALCGKTTNVQCVHKMLAPHQRGEMMSLATKDDRTLFFDFLPIELGDVKGFKTRFHIYTVPGQVYYALTRRAVLTGVDGVVFVADSQADKMAENIESLKDLNDNLKYYKKDISSVPFIMQYNKRDLDNILPVEELERKLNTLNVPSFEASAVQGTGVVETMTACCKLVLKQMDKGSGKKRRARTAAAPKPAAAPPVSPPPAASVSMGNEDDEPVIKIINDEQSAQKSDDLQPFVPDTAPAAAPPQTTAVENDEAAFDIDSLQLEDGPASSEPTPAYGADAEHDTLEIDDSSGSSLALEDGPLDIPQDEPIPPEPETVPSLETPSFDLPVEEAASFEIVDCGSPQKGPDNSLSIPLKVKVGQPAREATVTLSLRFDDFRLV